jgi:hypothetical protein
MPGSVNRTGGFASGRHETTPDTRRRRIGLTSPRLDDRGIGANHLVRVRWSQVADNVGRTWKSIGRLLNQVLSWLRNLMIDMPSERHVPESGTDTFNSRRFKNPTSIMFQRIIDAYRQRKRKQRSKYLTFLLAVRSALDDRGMTTDELFVEDLDFESLLQSAVNGS